MENGGVYQTRPLLDASRAAAYGESPYMDSFPQEGISERRRLPSP